MSYKGETNYIIILYSCMKWFLNYGDSQYVEQFWSPQMHNVHEGAYSCENLKGHVLSVLSKHNRISRPADPSKWLENGN